MLFTKKGERVRAKVGKSRMEKWMGGKNKHLSYAILFQILLTNLGL